MATNIEKARALIQECIDTQATFLDLGNLGLQDGDIPAELAKCTWLEALNLGTHFSYGYEKYKWEESQNSGPKNYFSAIPNEISQLTNLKKLAIKNCNIAQIEVLKALTQLRDLDLAGNPAIDWNTVGHLKQLEAINLSSNRISELGFLSKLFNLQVLDLFQNLITEINKLDKFTQLQQLNLSSNLITEIKKLDKLTQLQQLKLRDNQINHINKLDKLTQLQQLDLSDNQITEINKLDKLTQLQQLDLSDNQITEINKLDKLTQLQQLDLSDNQITEINKLDKLTQLQQLKLNFNQIAEISNLEQLTQLQQLELNSNLINHINKLDKIIYLVSLNLNSNQINHINNLEQLVQLRRLNLSDNQITEINKLDKLTQLQQLDLSDNQITEINKLDKLAQLLILNLSDNQITEINKLDKLAQLLILDLSDNQITKFPSFLLKKRKLFHLNIGQNKLQNLPYEIANQYNCLYDARNWFADLKQGSVNNYEVKLIIIGNGRVGKTCLVDRLLRGQYDDQKTSTHAIQIDKWELQLQDIETPLSVNVWDFGGQDIYHATHRWFMQSRALFILLWDHITENNPYYEEKDNHGDIHQYRNYKLPYWLDYVRSFSRNSPMIIVQNKIDLPLAPSDPPNQYNLKEMYGSNIKGQHRVSLKENRRLVGLKDLILDIFQNEMPEVGMKMPLSWYETREKLVALSKQKEYIPFEDFESVCREMNVLPASDKSLIRYLHDTGVVFYQAGLFENLIILNQEWAIKAVYLVFDRKSHFFRVSKQRGGIFQLIDLDIELSKEGYSKAQQQIILSFMESCQICFKLTRDEEDTAPWYVAPVLLHPQKPKAVGDFWKHNEQTIYYYVYEHPILHEAFIHRFMIAANHLVTGEGKLWRNGIHFTYQNTHCTVRSIKRLYGGNIHIQLTGDQVMDLLQLIQKTFRNIYHYKDIEIKERLSINGKDYVELKKLEEAAEAKNDNVRADNGEYIPIAPLLVFLKRKDREEEKDPEQAEIIQDLPANRQVGTITDKLSVLTNPMDEPLREKPKVFVSYCHEDEEALKRLRRHYQYLENEIDIWDDKKIQAGEKWLDEIEAALDQIKIAVLLLSIDFFNSKFIREKELPIILAAAAQKGTEIIPIILKPVRLKSYPEIKEYQSLNNPNYPFIKMSENDQEELGVKLADRIIEIIDLQ